MRDLLSKEHYSAYPFPSIDTHYMNFSYFNKKIVSPNPNPLPLLQFFKNLNPL